MTIPSSKDLEKKFEAQVLWYEENIRDAEKSLHSLRCGNESDRIHILIHISYMKNNMKVAQNRLEYVKDRIAAGQECIMSFEALYE